MTRVKQSQLLVLRHKLGLEFNNTQTNSKKKLSRIRRIQEETRLGLQCRTPLRSYPLSFDPYPLSPNTVPFKKFRWGFFFFSFFFSFSVSLSKSKVKILWIIVWQIKRMITWPFLEMLTFCFYTGGLIMWSLFFAFATTIIHLLMI